MASSIGLQQTDSPGDDPAGLFVEWLVGQLINLDPAVAQAVYTGAVKFDRSAWGKTLSQCDGFA